MVALGVFALQLLLYNVMERRTHALALMISTGIYRGAPIAVWHRWGLLQLAWFGVVGAQLVFMLSGGIGWVLVGGMANGDDLRLLTYLLAFISFGGVLGWLATTPFWYRRLSVVLREAGSD